MAAGDALGASQHVSAFDTMVTGRHDDRNLVQTLQRLRWRRRTKTPPRRTPPNAMAEAGQADHAFRHPRAPLSHTTRTPRRALGWLRSPDFGVNIPTLI